jgi:hypothetical protein
MRRSSILTTGILILCTLLSPTAARAGEVGLCDRACLRGMADALLASIAAHDPSRLPLSTTYLATLDGVPAALPMMSLWRTVGGFDGRFYVIDPVSEQVFLIATLKEGSESSLLFGRIEEDDHRVSQVELYVDRSRGDGGFMFDGDGPSRLPRVWTDAVPQAHLPSRAELLAAGRSMFDPAIAGPAIAASCRLMENGRLVAENPKVLAWVGGGGKTLRANPDGTVPIPCGSPPERPADPHARTDIADTKQGIVISIATVHGMVEPYLVTSPTVSAFVPSSLLHPYLSMLGHQRASGQFTQPALRATAASNTTVEMYRIFDGKLQGMHLLEHLEPPGAISPW